MAEDTLEGLLEKNKELLAETKTAKNKSREYEKTIADLQEQMGELKQGFDSTKSELEEAKQQATAATQREQSMKDALGNNEDPIKALQSLQEQVKAAAEWEAKVAKAKQEALAEANKTWAEKTESYRQQAEELNNTLHEDKKMKALRDLFEKQDGIYFGPFAAMSRDDLVPVYKLVSPEDAVKPKYEVTGFQDTLGNAISDPETGEIIDDPRKVLIQARKGAFGPPMQNTFLPWNQSSGGNIPAGKGKTGNLRPIKKDKAGGITLSDQDFRDLDEGKAQLVD